MKSDLLAAVIPTKSGILELNRKFVTMRKIYRLTACLVLTFIQCVIKRSFSFYYYYLICMLINQDDPVQEPLCQNDSSSKRKQKQNTKSKSFIAPLTCAYLKRNHLHIHMFALQCSHTQLEDILKEADRY